MRTGTEMFTYDRGQPTAFWSWISGGQRLEYGVRPGLGFLLCRL